MGKRCISLQNSYITFKNLKGYKTLAEKDIFKKVRECAVNISSMLCFLCSQSKSYIGKYNINVYKPPEK